MDATPEINSAVASSNDDDRTTAKESKEKKKKKKKDKKKSKDKQHDEENEDANELADLAGVEGPAEQSPDDTQKINFYPNENEAESITKDSDKS